MDNKYLFSDDAKVLATALNKAIANDKSSSTKAKARVGEDYYNYKHDILDNRIFYMDDNGVLREDRYASNVKIPHAFFTELVDQKVQYLLSNPVEYEVEDEAFKERLKEYYDEDFQLFLQEIVEEASKKGFSYAYARTNSNDKVEFEVSDSLQTFTVENDDGNQRIIRYYDKDKTVEGKNTTVTVAEVWTDEVVYFFVTNKNKRFEIDTSREINPRPHVIAKANDGTLLKRTMGDLPFYRLANNKQERTDLEPIKALIDDYDLMAAFLSNNLQDFAEAIYVVKGFRGDDLATLRQNIKAKKTVGVGDNGGVDVKTVEIPVEARKTKLDIDKEAIYKFGMGFDSTQIGDGNITNIVIKSRYALLDMKVNKAEVRLRAMLKWINEMIVADINRRYGTSFNAQDIEIKITRETMVNENDLVANEKIVAETREVIIQTILAVAPRLNDETVLKLICEQFELDWEEVSQLLEEQEYTSGLQDGTDPVEDDEDESAGQVE